LINKLTEKEVLVDGLQRLASPQAQERGQDAKISKIT
jgi:hypothetical protein